MVPMVAKATHAAEYVSKGWCANGAVVAGQEWTLGAEFNYPERELCRLWERKTRLQVTSSRILVQFQKGISVNRLISGVATPSR